jgi:hypothetical protein
MVCWMKVHVGREIKGISPTISETGKDPKGTNTFVRNLLCTERTPRKAKVLSRKKD